MIGRNNGIDTETYCIAAVM